MSTDNRNTQPRTGCGAGDGPNSVFRRGGGDPLALAHLHLAALQGNQELRLQTDAALLKELHDHQIDLVVLAGFLSVLGPSVIAVYPMRILNIHPSLIPSFCGPGYYGLRVHEEALKRGVKVTGATVHFVNEECDGGPILLQKAVEVLPGDTPEVLQKRVMEQAEWKLLPRAIAMVCNNEV